MIASRGVEFRLLGLLEVVAENEPVRIVRGRESALLALLLLHPNQPLATDRIVEELWGASAPVNAAKSVHIYVSRLRKALGGDRIETTSAGYRIRLEAGELDSDRFAQLASEGRRQEALALWRGEPLADFRFDAFAQSEIRRLEALRDEVWIDECEAEITDGRVAQAIPELEALIGRRPLWEQPREQLMRALYLGGRQADALELYRSTRVLLREELGVEPGSELQRLEREILNHDPALGAPSRPPQPLHRQHGFRLAAIGGALLLIATAALVALVLTRPGSTRTLPYIPNSLVRLDSHYEARRRHSPDGRHSSRCGHLRRPVMDRLAEWHRVGGVARCAPSATPGDVELHPGDAARLRRSHLGGGRELDRCDQSRLRCSRSADHSASVARPGRRHPGSARTGRRHLGHQRQQAAAPLQHHRPTDRRRRPTRPALRRGRRPGTALDPLESGRHPVRARPLERSEDRLDPSRAPTRLRGAVAAGPHRRRRVGLGARRQPAQRDPRRSQGRSGDDQSHSESAAIRSDSLHRTQVSGSRTPATGQSAGSIPRPTC